MGARIAEMVLGETDQVWVTTYLADGRKAGVTVLTTSAVTIGFETLATREVSTVMAEGGPAPGFLVNYSDGVVQSADPEISSLSITNGRPVGLDSWVGATPVLNSLTGADSVIHALAGPSMALNFSPWPEAAGNQAGTNAATANFRTNYNAAEFLTAAPPSFVFDTFVRQFAGINQGAIARVSVPPGGVTGIGQQVLFQMLNPLQTGQVSPVWFAVETVRFDSLETALAAKTLPGHPLVGWRYWHVTQPASGRIKVETGAFDRPADGLFYRISDWLFRNQQTELWRGYLQYIIDDLQATPLDVSLIGGVWDSVDKTYIMTRVCGHAPTSSGLCQ